MLDGVRGDADRTCVVTHEDSRGLRVPKIGEDIPQANSVLSTGEESCVFCFTRAGYDARDDRREDMYSAVDFERLIAIAEEEVSTSDRASVRAGEIRRVDV